MFFLSTLKGRFTIFAVVLVLVALLAAVTAQKNIKTTSDAVAVNLSIRYASQIFSQQIYNGLFESYKKLTAFLLDPARVHLPAEIHIAIENAIVASHALASVGASNSHLVRYSPSDQLIELTRLLNVLDKDFKAVLNTRLTNDIQYPALGVGNEILRPNRIQFINAVTIAIYELELGRSLGVNSNEIYNKNVHHTFLQTRFLWSQMVSNFRLYMANRLGSFNETALSRQEVGIANLYAALQVQLDLLKQFESNGELGFESSDALEEMQESVRRWYAGFTTVSKIHHSGEWRADVVLIKQNIEPKLEQVLSILTQLSALTDAESVHDIGLMGEAAKQQSYFMWIASLIIIVFFALTIFSFNTFFLKPVRLVARSMKAVAFGDSGASLPAVGAKETQDLMDAFNEMRLQVRNRQFELEHQALHDSLTGLANRTLLRDRLGQALHSANQSQTHCVLLILDLNNFKAINDSLGHTAGDMLVIEVGIRLENIVREIDSVARLGGDEFAILLPQSNMPHARRMINKIEQALQSIRYINSTQVYVSGTIGAAIFPEHGKNANVLLRHANAALHFSQNSQKPFHFYDEQSKEINPDRLTLSGDLRDAIKNSHLYLEYQPQLDFKTEKVIGVEALIRWQHPRLGYIAADQIVLIAEQTGQINAMTHWVMDTAFKQCATWRKQGWAFGMSINLSVLNLHDETLIDGINKCLSRHALAHSSVTFEITESAMMTNPVSAMKMLKALEAMGLKLVIDDFGTGFSSLSYLKQLPVEKLKLDKSFVLSVDKESDDEVIVRSTIELAHNLGLTVVAEGVENEASWNILKNLGCDFAQGFYMSKPKKAEELEGWLNDFSTVN